MQGLNRFQRCLSHITANQCTNVICPQVELHRVGIQTHNHWTTQGKAQKRAVNMFRETCLEFES